MDVSMPRVKPSSRNRAILAGVAGHVVEWYDYSVYAFFAAVIGRLFFPSGTPYGSLLLSFAVFGVGFFTRPLGGIVFGHYGDKLGRRNTLVVAVVMMSLSTFLVGVLPSFATIGIAAPILLVLFRLVQGFSAGGEWAGAGSFLVEYAPQGRRGVAGALQQSVSASVSLLALASQACLHPP